MHEMGDVRGRIHLEKQDLGRLQTRKMKGLKERRGGDEDVSGGDSEGDDGIDDYDSTPKRKRMKSD